VGRLEASRVGWLAAPAACWGAEGRGENDLGEMDEAAMKRRVRCARPRFFNYALGTRCWVVCLTRAS